MDERIMNEVVFGKLGKASKLMMFKENEFKPELAPQNAKIEQVEINGEKLVRMRYDP